MPSHSDLCSKVSFQSGVFCLPVVVFSVPLCPLPTQYSHHLSDKCPEGNALRDLRVTGRGLTRLRLIVCCLSLPVECDLQASRDLSFLIYCGVPRIHLQQYLARENHAMITVAIFNFLLRDTLCFPTLQNSTVHGLLRFYHRVDSQPCGNTDCLQV